MTASRDEGGLLAYVLWHWRQASRLPSACSAPLEHRRALLAEGADAFRRVLGFEADVLRHGLDLERSSQIEVFVGVERSLGEADGHGRPRRDPAGDLVGRRQEL